MAGWQWAFVITGLLGLVLATVVFFCLPDWPDSPPSRRQFLSADEAAFMVARLPPNASKSTDKNFDWQAIKRDLSGGLICKCRVGGADGRVVCRDHDACAGWDDGFDFLASDHRAVLRHIGA